MDQLNSREISTLLWGLIIFITFIIVSLKNRKLRPLLVNLLKNLFTIKIITTIFLTSIYSMGIIFLLNFLNLWDISQIKNTIFWFLTFAIGTLFQINKIKDNSNHFFKDTIKTSFSIVIALQFLINFYTFNFYIEFIFVIPLVTSLIIINTFSSKNKKNNKIEILTSRFIIIIFFIFFINLLINFLKSYQDFFNIKTFKDFFTPLLLTVLYFPFLWIFLLYIKYEEIFVRLPIFIKNKRIINYAKILVILKFKADKSLIDEWFHHIKIHRINNIYELFESVNLINIRKKREKPIFLNLDFGWNPDDARLFLRNQKLVVNYNDIGEEIWFGSNSINLNESFNSPSLSYFIQGNENIVTQLKFKLFLYDINQTTKYLNRFIEISNDLLMNSLVSCLPLNKIEMIKNKKNFRIILKNKNIEFSYEEFSYTLPYKCEFIICIKNSI